MLSRPRTLLILAGGRGTRLGGVRKALVRVRGRTILQRIVDTLGPLADERIALVHDDEFPNTEGVELVVDATPYAGPLPAVLHGLRVAHGDVCMLVAADMPFVSPTAFAYLLDLQARESAAAVVPFIDGHLQPMHAVFDRRRLVDALEAAEPAGEQRIFKVLESLQPRLVEADELRTVDPELHTLFNVNTPEDLALAERLAQ
jgi:molybdopterin-guanine dinucleotide biosynthesis protein A